MNIVFIGMPGSGKTTIGKLVAEKLNKIFYDLDSMIEQGEGESIKEIFKKGEDYFRMLEYKYLSEISKKNNIIIATGGGTIIKPEAAKLIKKGYVIFLDRSIDDIISTIDSNARPLLIGNARENLEKLYDERINKYEELADYKIKVTNVEDTILKIIDHLKREAIWKYYLYWEQI